MPEWQAFADAANQADVCLNQVRRLPAAGLHVDLSGQRYSPQLEEAAAQLLEARQFNEMRQGLLSGEVCNPTENRAAWHTALRAPAPTPEITAERERLNDFLRTADASRMWRNILHFGIGGRDWGVCRCVSVFGYSKLWRNVRFVANIDGHAIEGALADLNPHDTLVVVASKSFTTVETLENAQRALEWLEAANVPNPQQQMVAITARADTAKKWGIPENNIFRL